MKYQFEIFERPSEYILKNQNDFVFTITTLHNFIIANAISINIHDEKTPIRESQIQIKSIQGEEGDKFFTTKITKKKLYIKYRKTIVFI